MTLPRTDLTELIPDRWVGALRAGIAPLLLTWLLCVVISASVYAGSVVFYDSGSVISLRGAVSTGAWLWGLGFGARWQVEGDMTLALPALTVTLITVALLRHSIRRVDLSGLVAVAWASIAAGLTGYVGMMWADGPGLRWPVGLVSATLVGVMGAVDCQQRGCGSDWLAQRLALLPAWVSTAREVTASTLRYLATLAGGLLLLAMVLGMGRVSYLHDLMTSGGIIPGLGLVLVQVLWLPTMMVWSLSWLSGPGFAVGQGTHISPTLVTHGPLPSLPILGALPESALPSAASLFFLTIMCAALLAVWRHRHALRLLRYRHALAAAGSAGLGLGVAAVLAWVATRGSVGPGTLTHTGASPWAMLTFTAQSTAGLCLGATLIHPILGFAGQRAWAAAQQVGGSHDASEESVSPPSSSDTETDTPMAPTVSTDSPAVAPGALADAAADATESAPFPQDASATDAAAGAVTDADDSATSSAETSADSVALSDAKPLRVVVMVSGTGSNLARLLEASADPSYGVQICGVVADMDCPALAHADAAEVPTAVVSLSDYESRTDWNLALADAVEAFAPELVVCAGFMKILGVGFLARFPGAIINTHPSLLPNYPGAHAVRDALEDGATVTGATVFWVDSGVDTGAHIAQVSVPVHDGDTEDSLTERVKAAETPQLLACVHTLAQDRSWQK